MRERIENPGRRRLAFMAIVATAGFAALLAGCAGFLGGPRTIEIPKERIEDQLARRFPLNRRMLELVDVTVDTPTLSLLPDQNRVATEFHLSAGQSLLGSAFRGTLAMTYGLRFEPSDATIRLSDVRVTKFDLSGVSDPASSRLNRLGALVAEDLLDDMPIHRLSQDDLRRAASLGYKPGAINVTARGLAVTLEPSGSSTQP